MDHGCPYWIRQPAATEQRLVAGRQRGNAQHPRCPRPKPLWPVAAWHGRMGHHGTWQQASSIALVRQLAGTPYLLPTLVLAIRYLYVSLLIIRRKITFRQGDHRSSRLQLPPPAAVRLPPPHLPRLPLPLLDSVLPKSLDSPATIPPPLLILWPPSPAPDISTSTTIELRLRPPKPLL